MKIIGILIIIIAAILIFYFVGGSKDDLLADPDVQKFAIINAELSIEFEHMEQDSTSYIPLRDSIYEYYNISEEWMGEITERINEQPELWDEVYELIIKRAEMIKDSLLHKRPLSGDSV